MINIEYKTIRNLAIVVALLLAPVLSYGSAYMLYTQIEGAKKIHARNLVQAPVNPSQQLPDDLRAQIAAAIDVAQLD